MSSIGIFSLSPLKSGCLLEKSMGDSADVDLNILYNNTKIGLSEYYNKIINDPENLYYKYIILCHHDISLRYANLATCLKDGLDRFDIIGVAGGINPVVKEKNLWHWMMNREDYRGIAAHSSGKDNMFMTSFGPFPDRVAVLDGVFLAFETEKIHNSKARFDEKFKWHHYDIDFSLTCNKNKLRLGVWPVFVYHESPGLRDINDIEWNRSNEYFRQKWSK